tara:strand:+ start:4895 stop:5242 length:348 start_codon:yes stop_codon:yes gene_type:complete
METEITLEYGKKLNERRIMHQELLCCHSTGAQDLFKRAQPLREAYPLANAVRKQLKTFIPPEVSSQEFEDDHMEEKVVSPLHTPRKSRVVNMSLTFCLGVDSHLSDLRKISSAGV